MPMCFSWGRIKKVQLIFFVPLLLILVGCISNIQPKDNLRESHDNIFYEKAGEFEIKENWPGMINHALLWIKDQPQNDDAWFCLGFAFQKSDQTPKAIEAYQQAIRINPEHVMSWYNLGYAYRKSGQTVKAIEACQQAIRINPEHADAWYNLGLAYQKSDQPNHVKEVYERLKTIDPAKAATFNLLVPYQQKEESLSKTYGAPSFRLRSPLK